MNMPYTFDPLSKNYAPSFDKLYKPARDAMTAMTPLQSRGNRPLHMSFDEHLRSLVFFHLEEHTSAQHLLQVLEEDDLNPWHRRCLLPVMIKNQSLAGSSLPERRWPALK